jgi:hypothetical protein
MDRNTSQVRIGQGILLRVENRPGNTSQDRGKARGILSREKIMPGKYYPGQRIYKGILLRIERSQGNTSQGGDYARKYFSW